MSKVRNYTFTVNNPDWQELFDYAMFAEDYANYMIVGFEEAPDTGTPHFQGYVNLKQPHTFSFMKKRMPTAHIEATEGTSDQNITYCSKGGDFWEYGERPQAGRARWDKIVEVMKDPKSNPHLYNQYYKTFRRLSIEDATNRVWGERKIYWYYGAEALPKEDITDWDTYEGERYVVVDLLNMKLNWLNILHMWHAGLPTKIRRGFEVIKFNPQVVYVKTNDIDKHFDEYPLKLTHGMD